jgi:large subunit ribosomal protein L3
MPDAERPEMNPGILGKKLGMTQFFQADGTWVPVTVVEAGPCKVMQVKVKDVQELPEEHRVATTNRGKPTDTRATGKLARPRRADGYYAVQLGFDDKRERNASKAETGHAGKAGSTPKAFIRELRMPTLPTVKQGDEIKVDVLKDIKRVDVVGITKGRGFTGTIKRWNFHRQGMSHGNSKHHRKVGGIGRTYSISKGVPKGKKMSGHYGVEQVTVHNIELVKIDAERNLLFLRGAVPGHRNGYVIVKKSTKVTVARQQTAATGPAKKKKE